MKIKITAIKQFEPKDIIGEDVIRGNGQKIEKCGYGKEGNVYYVPESGNIPEGFCHHAWFGLYKNISVLRNEGNFKNWTGKDMIYSACPDGIRPVIFKVERIND
ncbi:MAG: TIGR04076 family protein [Promethearchaeota archaeon]